MNLFVKAAALFAILALQACSAMPATPDFTLPFGVTPQSAQADVAPPAQAASRDGVGRAIDLLSTGKVDVAKVELAKILEASPKDATALRLMAQIENDPVKLLGAESRDYVVAPGDTMSALAGRHLGDPLMFYALSRYNGLASPNALAVGKILKIPSRGAKSPEVANAGSAPPAQLPASSKAAASGSEAADKIRLQALDFLNRGDVTQALGLLRQADAMKQDDPAIQRDIQRALRIQSALDGG